MISVCNTIAKISFHFWILKTLLFFKLHHEFPILHSILSLPTFQHTLNSPSIARSCSIGGFAAAPVTIDKKKKLQINNTSAFCLAYQSTTGHQPGATVFTTVRMTQSRIFNLHNTTDSATAQPKVLNHLNTFSNFTSLCLTQAEKTSHRKRKTIHPHLRIISR